MKEMTNLTKVRQLISAETTIQACAAWLPSLRWLPHLTDTTACLGTWRTEKWVPRILTGLCSPSGLMCSLHQCMLRCGGSPLILKLASTARFQSWPLETKISTHCGPCFLCLGSLSISWSLCTASKDVLRSHVCPTGLGTWSSALGTSPFNYEALCLLHELIKAASCTLPIMPAFIALRLPLMWLLQPSGPKRNISHFSLSPILSSSYTLHIIISQICMFMGAKEI